MVGTLYTAKISTKLPKADYYLFIVRSAGNLHPGIVHNLKNYYHEPSLSPSFDLFKQYLKWRGWGMWSSTTYNDMFTPAFREEMLKEPMKSSLDDLEHLLESGYDVCIMCWCGRLCHRYIVADEMACRGCTVIKDEGS